MTRRPLTVAEEMDALRAAGRALRDAVLAAMLRPINRALDWIWRVIR